MNTNDIKNEILGYDKHLQNDKKQFFDELENLRNSFVQEYSESKVRAMGIENYVLGLNNNNDSFCYKMEYTLTDLGNIQGAQAIKHGIYFGKQGQSKKPSYHYKKCLGKNKDEAFANLKEEICTLIREGGSEDKTVILQSKISPMLRGKILYVYHPLRYLPIYSDSSLDYFISKLSLKSTNMKDPYFKQKILLEFKNGNKILKKWTNIQYANFLFELLGKPNQNAVSEEFADEKLLQEVNLHPTIQYDVSENEDCPKKKGCKHIVKGVSVYVRNINEAKKALAMAEYECEIDPKHETFIRKKEDINYTEPHHLIPMSFQSEFSTSLDVAANIVSLCSGCHNKIHYGRDYEDMIKLLYKKRRDRLKNAGIVISLENLLSYYK